MNLKSMLRIVAATTLLCVVVFIRIPLFVPVTLQTFVVVLIGLIFKPQEAFISVLLYLGIGLIGIPVFASGVSVAAFMSPAGGFLMLFPIQALTISLFKTKKRKIYIDLCMLMIVVIGLTYLMATAWFVYQTKTNYFKALIGFGLYMAVDIAKILIAYLIYKQLPQTFLDEIASKNGGQFRQHII